MFEMIAAWIGPRVRVPEETPLLDAAALPVRLPRPPLGSDRTAPVRPATPPAESTTFPFTMLPIDVFVPIGERLRPREQFAALPLMLVRRSKDERRAMLVALPQTAATLVLERRLCGDPANPGTPETEALIAAAHGGGPCRKSEFRRRLREIEWLDGKQRGAVDACLELVRVDPALAGPIAENVDILEPEDREAIITELRDVAWDRTSLVAAAKAMRDLPHDSFGRQLRAFLQVAKIRPKDRTALHVACSRAFDKYRFGNCFSYSDVEQLLDVVRDDASLRHIAHMLTKVAEDVEISDMLTRIGAATDSVDVQRELAHAISVHSPDRRLDVLRTICARGDAQACTTLASRLSDIPGPPDRIAACDALMDASHDPAVIRALLREVRRWETERRERSRSTSDPISVYYAAERKRLIHRIVEESHDSKVLTDVALSLDMLDEDEAALIFTKLRPGAAPETALALVRTLPRLPQHLRPIEFRRLREAATRCGDRAVLAALRKDVVDSASSHSSPGTLHLTVDRAFESEAVRRALGGLDGGHVALAQ